MAVEASPPDSAEQRGARRGAPGKTSRLGPMRITGVAFLTQEGRPRLEQVGCRRPVRVVAAGAVHFSLAHGMMRKFVLGAHLLFMTGSARIRDGYSGKLITVPDSRSRMDRVAICASDALGGMSTPRPEKPIPLLMALEADIVAHVNRRCRPLRKSNHPRE